MGHDHSHAWEAMVLAILAVGALPSSSGHAALFRESALPPHTVRYPENEAIATSKIELLKSIITFIALCVLPFCILETKGTVPYLIF